MRSLLGGAFLSAVVCLSALAGNDWRVPSPEDDNNAAVIALTNALAQAQAGDTVTLSKGVYDLEGFVSHVDATCSDSHLYMPGRKILLRGDPACTRDEVVLKGGGSIRILRIKDGSNGLTKAPAFENLTFTNGVTAYWAGAVYLTGNDADCGYYTNCAFRCCSSKDRCGTAWAGTFSHCYFEGNKAGANYGGCSSRSAAYDCVFVNNSAAGNGGALNLSDAYCCAFTNNTRGYCPEMDEDDGAMSAWYVYSCMGLYPVVVGEATYELFSPLFDHIRISLDEGQGEKYLTIATKNRTSMGQKVKKITWNGRTVKDFRIKHTILKEGGELLFWY